MRERSARVFDLIFDAGKDEANGKVGLYCHVVGLETESVVHINMQSSA